MEVGNRIRDVEDSDCYYEGFVVELNPLKYKVTNIVWDGEIDKSMNGDVLMLRWWKVQVFVNGRWVYEKSKINNKK